MAVAAVVAQVNAVMAVILVETLWMFSVVAGAGSFEALQQDAGQVGEAEAGEGGADFSFQWPVISSGGGWLRRDGESGGWGRPQGGCRCRAGKLRQWGGGWPGSWTASRP